MPLQGIGQGFESPHLHQNFQRFLESTERLKTERFERTEENVDNRIQYVGQIAREGKLSNKKPKSRNHRKCKDKREEERKRKKKLISYF